VCVIIIMVDCNVAIHRFGSWLKTFYVFIMVCCVVSNLKPDICNTKIWNHVFYCCFL